jgi:hypothetical protein
MLGVAPVLPTPVIRAHGISALCDHVRRVVRWCSHEEVRRIHARGVVAGVADKQPFRDRTVGQHVGVPVSEYRAAFSHREPAVSLGVALSSPLPAAIRVPAVHLCPEPDRGRGGRSGLHSQAPTFVVHVAQAFGLVRARAVRFRTGTVFHGGSLGGSRWFPRDADPLARGRVSPSYGGAVTS